MTGGQALDTHRGTLAAAGEALSGLGAELWRAGSSELAAVVGEVDRLGLLCEAARVAVVAEVFGGCEPGSGTRR